MRPLLFGLGAVLFIVAGCSSDGDETETTSASSLTTEASATSTTQLVGAEAVEPWDPFSEATVSFGGGPLPVLVADTPEQRSQGLMFVTDLQGYAGMLFVFEDIGAGGFWMKNTIMPLTVLYLDEDGAEVSRAEMEPCVDGNDCPGYPPDGPYLYALEMPTGSELLPASPAQVEIVLPQ